MAAPRPIALIEPAMDPAMVNAAANALRKERFLHGESVAAFENAFAKFVGTKHAVAVNNGTNALVFAVQALGLGRGDEVAVPSASFAATANAVVMAGAEPVFIDIDPATATMDPEHLASVLNRRSRVRAVMPVHLYGRMADLKALERVARQHGIALIEDACQAHGAEAHGKRAGAVGAAGAFSFYPSKNMTVGGDGGMLTTNRKAIADYARSVRDGGRAPGHHYKHTRVGTTARLQTSNAAIGLLQLRRLRRWNARRRALARRYRRGLADVGQVSLPAPDVAGTKNVYHLFVIQAAARDRLAAHLANEAIHTGVHYPIPIHRQPAYKDRPGAKAELPHTDRWSKRVLSLPMHPRLSNQDQDRIIASLRAYYGVSERAS